MCVYMYGLSLSITYLTNLYMILRHHASAYSSQFISNSEPSVPLTSIPSIRFGAGFLARTFARFVKDLVDVAKGIADKKAPQVNTMYTYSTYMQACEYYKPSEYRTGIFNDPYQILCGMFLPWSLSLNVLFLINLFSSSFNGM